MKLSGTVRVIKKCPAMTTDLVPAGITEKRLLLCMAEKSFFFAKNPFFPKKHLQFAETLIFIWEKGTFLFAQLFSVVASTWLELKSGCLIGTENSDLDPKNPFFAINFVNGPFVALRKTIHFAP